MKIPTSPLGLTAIAFALVLGGCASTPQQRAAGEVLDDTSIATRVKMALIESPEVKANQVEVEAFRGVVQLSGFVETPEMARKAEDAARRVQGVKTVKNDIRIRPKQ